MHDSGNTSNTDAGAALGAPQWGWVTESQGGCFPLGLYWSYSASVLWTLPSLEGQGSVLSGVLP